MVPCRISCLPMGGDASEPGVRLFIAARISAMLSMVLSSRSSDWFVERNRRPSRSSFFFPSTRVRPLAAIADSPASSAFDKRESIDFQQTHHHTRLTPAMTCSRCVVSQSWCGHGSLLNVRTNELESPRQDTLPAYSPFQLIGPSSVPSDISTVSQQYLNTQARERRKRAVLGEWYPSAAIFR